MRLIRELGVNETADYLANFGFMNDEIPRKRILITWFCIVYANGNGTRFRRICEWWPLS